MSIKRSGSALISAVIILSLMSLLGAMYYKMTKYNIQLEALNYNHDDRYNLSKEENDVIYEFMKKINTRFKNSEEEITTDLLCNMILESTDGDVMKYNSERNRFILKFVRKDGSEKYRDIDYRIDNKKIILIPSSVFEEKNVQFD